MSRCRSPLPLLVLALLVVSCRSPRKALELDCLKADRYLAKAVWLCPDVLRRDSASITVRLPGDSLTTVLEYTDPIVPDLLKNCEDFAAAVAMENAYLRDSINAARTVQDLPPALVPRHGSAPNADKGTPTPLRIPPKARAPLERIRAEACAFEPYEERQGRIILKVSPGPYGRPVITARIKEDSILVKAPCPPHVVRPPQRSGWQVLLDDMLTSVKFLGVAVGLLLLLVVMGPKPIRWFVNLVRGRWK